MSPRTARAASVARTSAAGPPVSTPARSGLLQRRCACGGTAGPSGECVACRRKRLAGGGLFQAKLRVNQPGDAFEREADRVAEQVMRMPGPVLQRQEDEEEEEEFLQAKPLIQRRVSGEAGGGAAPPIVHDVLRSPGRPLEPSTRRFMEARLGHDFSQVRIHADGQAAASAQAVNARAFTVGRDVVFGPGEYAPGSWEGQRLLAHELVHVVQQGKTGSVAPAMLQRQEATRTREVGADAVDDPSFLLCLILCYLGIPPAIWKRAVELFLQAVWEEYRALYGERAARPRFRSYRDEFRTYSAFKVLKTILTFVVHGKIGFIPVRAAAAVALRRQLEAFLVRSGATVAKLAVAEQIARKVAIAVEAAFVAGCAVYCGGLAYARLMVEMSQVIAEGIVNAMRGLEIVGEIAGSLLTQIFVRPVLVARAMVNPMNWDLGPLPTRTRAHLNVIGFVLWSNMGVNDPDQFLTNVSRPLNSYPIPDVLREIAEDITTTLNRRGGFYALVQFTPELIGGMSLLTLVRTLQEWHLLRFRRSPEAIADELLQGSPE